MPETDDNQAIAQKVFAALEVLTSENLKIAISESKKSVRDWKNYQFEQVIKILEFEFGDKKLVTPSETKKNANINLFNDTEISGRAPKTRITHFVIMSHVFHNTRDSSIETIYRELLVSGLTTMEKRGSLVTSLNRLKSDQGYLNWQDSDRGSDIKITPSGEQYRLNLWTKKLLHDEISFIRSKFPNFAIE